MVDQQDENNGNEVTNEDMTAYVHGTPLNPIVLNGANSSGEELDESRSSESPAEHLEGDEENFCDSTSLIPEQDRYLPIANIGRIMKRAVPGHGKIAKEAKECVQECVSEFISFLTSEASDKCLYEKRKTITVDDMVTAMRSLDLDEYADVLTFYMKRFREAHRGRSDQLSGSSIYAEGNPDELQDSMNNEASSSTGATTTNGVSEAYQPVTIPAANGAEPVVRVLPTNAQVLLDASGNHYLTWQTPEGTQIVQVQAANTMETPTVPLIREEVAFVSSDSNNTAEANQVASNTPTSTTSQARTYRTSQQFHSGVQQGSNDAHQSSRQVSHSSVNTSAPLSSTRYTRSAPSGNSGIPAKRSRDSKTQVLRS